LRHVTKKGNEKGIARTRGGYLIRYCGGLGEVHNAFSPASKGIEGARAKLAELMAAHPQKKNPHLLRFNITDKNKSGVIGVAHSIRKDMRPNRRGAVYRMWVGSWSVGLPRPITKSFSYGTLRTEEEAFYEALRWRLGMALEHGGYEAYSIVLKALPRSIALEAS
jgi:hypothetical protein